MEPSHQTSSFSQFLPALWLFCSPIYCCPPGVRSKTSSTQAGTASAPSPGNVGWAQGAPCSLELWTTVFQGLLELLRFGWDQGGEMTKLMFSAANLLTCVEKYRGRDGRQCRDAHVITQTSPFWLLLSPRERHKHRKAENS